MASYPPPPPPPGGPYPPYDPYVAKAQYRAQRDAVRAQQRAIRAQQVQQAAVLRAQRRAMRRGSIVGPLILLSLGIVFLLAEMRKISGYYALEWFGHWWPAVLIGAGVVLLIEWALDQQRNDGVGPRSLGGGVVSLLIFLAFAGLFASIAVRSMQWKDAHLGRGFGQFDEVFGDRNDSYDAMTSAIAPGAVLVVRSPRGDVTVTGDSSDGQVHVNIHKQAYAWNDSDVQRKVQQLQPAFSTEGKDLVLTVSSVGGGQDDLTITVPNGSAVTVNADHGDIHVNGLKAALSLSANHGDVDISGIEGNVLATVNDDDASVTMHDLTGAVSIEGHTGDIDIGNVNGALTLQGDFYGTTHLQKVSGAVRFITTRTNFSAARLDDEFSVEKDSLDAGGLFGPVVLKTGDKDITLERVRGSVEVTNKNGAVNVTEAAPVATVAIQNQHGSVDLGLPPSAGFTLSAQTRNGDMENDFGLQTQDNGETHMLHGAVSGGGPTITVATTDGDVTVRKSTVAPLPPALPVPPTPPAAPKAPKAPPAPKAPASYTF